MADTSHLKEGEAETLVRYLRINDVKGFRDAVRGDELLGDMAEPQPGDEEQFRILETYPPESSFGRGSEEIMRNEGDHFGACDSCKGLYRAALEQEHGGLDAIVEERKWAAGIANIPYDPKKNYRHIDHLGIL